MTVSLQRKKQPRFTKEEIEGMLVIGALLLAMLACLWLIGMMASVQLPSVTGG